MADKNKAGTNAHSQSPEELQKQIEALKAKLQASEEEKTVLLDSNKELQGELEAANETVKTVKKVVTVEKKQYEILVAQIKHGGKVYTAEEISKDTKLAKELIELKSGAIRPLK